MLGGAKPLARDMVFCGSKMQVRRMNLPRARTSKPVIALVSKTLSVVQRVMGRPGCVDARMRKSRRSWKGRVGSSEAPSERVGDDVRRVIPMRAWRSAREDFLGMRRTMVECGSDCGEVD